MPMWLFDFVDELFMPNPEKDDRVRYLKRLVVIVVTSSIIGYVAFLLEN